MKSLSVIKYTQAETGDLITDLKQHDFVAVVKARFLVLYPVVGRMICCRLKATITR